MAECSQEFKDMLEEFYGEAYEDGKHGCEGGLSFPTLYKLRQILQYVARLEAIRDKAREVSGLLAADMVGGMP